MGDDGSLRRGDLVDVRSAAEILATLDERGEMDKMPFMPEMVAYCGRRFRVEAQAAKVCDTVMTSFQSRFLPNTVLLDDARCDGSGHDGCQAECRFYWNEAWLRRVSFADPPAAPPDASATEALLARLTPNTRSTADDGEVRYRCQNTQLVDASQPMSTTDPRPYFRELTSGNVNLRTFARVMGRAAWMQPAHHFDLLRRPKGPSTTSPKSEPLGLQPGDWVRVKSRDEIEKTLTTSGKNRGLYFDVEMLPFCGRVLQVRDRVTHIIDESSGRMLHFKSDCVKLEGAVCSGERSTGRFFCPRAIYPYWRDCWLERVDGPDAA